MLGKIRQNLNTLGFSDTCYYALHRVLRTAGIGLFRYEILAQPVMATALLSGRRGKSITVRQLARDDPAMAELLLDADILQFRFQQGAIGFGAFHDTRAVGCLWLCLNGYLEDEVRCRFVPKPAELASWDFGLYVDPAYRTGIAFARLWDVANQFLRERGFQWTISRISRFNMASIQSARALRAVSCARMFVVRAGVWQLFFATIPPRIHFSPRTGNIPTYEIDVPDRPVAAA